jgi:hypothetical protein
MVAAAPGLVAYIQETSRWAVGLEKWIFQETSSCSLAFSPLSFAAHSRLLSPFHSFVLALLICWFLISPFFPMEEGDLRFLDLFSSSKQGMNLKSFCVKQVE